MSQSQALVRIAVVEADAPPPGAAQVLARIGEAAVTERSRDARGCLDAASRGEIDLVVLDRVSDEVASEVLSALRGAGPPVVVVTADLDQATALAAFRSGAADCVRVSEGFEEVLPQVALEQIRRWRQLCERGAVERRLRWLERLNDAIVTEIPAALAVVDGRERVVALNPEFSRALGADASAIGKPFDAVFPEDLIETGELRRLLAETAADRQAPPRLARTRPLEGSQRIFDVRARRLDEKGRVLVVLADVTQRAALTKRLEDLKRYNENIIQNMNSALLVVDGDGAITFANATAEQILAVEPGRLHGRSFWDWMPATPRERSLLARTLGEGVRFRGAETVLTRGDGEIVPIGISCAPLVDADGSRSGAVAIFQDLTEIKQLQRQVLQTEKMASIGQLAAGVAHEINNPTGFIHANLYQMAEYLGDLRQVWERVERLSKAALSGSADETRRAAQDLESLSQELDMDYLMQDFAKAIRESQEGSERIRHIVQDLREFSHQDTEEPVPADVNQCVDSTASIVWTMMKHSVVLQKQYSDLPEVRCYPMQLKQVFMNLLVNSYQAIEQKLGPGSSDTGEIEIQTQRVRDAVVVSIRDTGVGIPAEHLDRIFDPFFTTKEVGAGTGLGLSTSYSIVRRHGGSIRVRSTPGEGSTFEVRLPIDAGEPASEVRGRG